MAPRIGECLPEILELKVALVLVEFEPMVVVVPFLVESELFHGGVVEDRWLETQTVSSLVAFSLIALSVAVRAPKAGLQALVQQAQAAPELWALLRRRPQCS